MVPFAALLLAQVSDPNAVLDLAPLTAPAAGETAVDPTFGVVIRRLTDLGEQGGLATVEYPQLQAVNADETRILITTDSDRRVMDTSTWQITHQGLSFSMARWSPTDPDIIYSMNQRTSPMFLRQTELFPNGTEVTTNIVDVTGLGFESLDLGSWEDFSEDGRYVGLLGVMTGMGEVGAVLDVQAQSLLAVVLVSNVDWVAVSPSGRYLAVQYVACGNAETNGLAVYDAMTGAFLGHVSNHFAHGDLGRSSGDDVFVTAGDPTLCAPARPRYVVSPLPDSFEQGTQRVLSDPGTAIAIYTSCRSYLRPGLCANSDEWDVPGARPLAGEVFLTRLSDGAVLRLAHHRSRACSYYTQTRPVLSPSGRFILFTSDWARTNCMDQGDLYLIDTQPFLEAWFSNQGQPDAGTADAEIDAGSSADAAEPIRDAGFDAGVVSDGGDAGAINPERESSCGCSAARSAKAPFAPILLLLLLGVALTTRGR